MNRERLASYLMVSEGLGEILRYNGVCDVTASRAVVTSRVV